ncbi:kinase-like protein [Xylariaceae sp. FL0594]|nr:kinase-like protein [Xylariaceae sp. FL0594]
MAPLKRVYFESQSHLPLWLKLRIWAGSIIHPRRNKLGRARQVHRLPFGRIVKLRCSANELAAMEFVWQNTTIPVPQIYEIYEYDGGAHIVMEEVHDEGKKHMTEEQAKTFGRELADCIAQMRALVPPNEGFIGSVLLGPNIDHRLSAKRPFGPFTNVADFHTYLRRGRPLAHWASEPDVVRTHSRPEWYAVRFTHADLYPDNILTTSDGRIAAIIDWEAAWKQFYDAVEGEEGIVKYTEELAGERAICARMHPWSYDEPPWQPGDDEKRLAVRWAVEEEGEEEEAHSAGAATPSTSATLG